MPLVGVIVTFCTLVLIIRYGKVTEDSKAILTELRNGSFSQAQIKLTEFSGTDASQLDENGVARISVETQVLKLAENVFIPLAWFALGGLPGILLYWTSTVIAHRHGSGETSERWVALLNWVPIRLMALTLGFMGDRERCTVASNFPPAVNNLPSGRGHMHVTLSRCPSSTAIPMFISNIFSYKII